MFFSKGRKAYGQWKNQEGTKEISLVPSKSRTPGTTTTVASSRTWRGLQRYRRPALVACFFSRKIFVLSRKQILFSGQTDLWPTVFFIAVLGVLWNYWCRTARCTASRAGWQNFTQYLYEEYP
jgi:hypothetical protein